MVAMSQSDHVCWLSLEKALDFNIIQKKTDLKYYLFQDMTGPVSETSTPRRIFAPDNPSAITEESAIR